jgi:hypothetical protein
LSDRHECCGGQVPVLVLVPVRGQQRVVGQDALEVWCSFFRLYVCVCVCVCVLYLVVTLHYTQVVVVVRSWAERLVQNHYRSSSRSPARSVRAPTHTLLHRRKGKVTQKKSVAGIHAGCAIHALRLTCRFEIRPFAGVESRWRGVVRGESASGKHDATTSIHVNGEKWLCHHDLKV